jgi:hypothetical protein
MTDDQILKVAQETKDIVRKERFTYLWDLIKGQEIYKDCPLADIEKVAREIVKDKEFSFENDTNRFKVFMNPNYDLEQSIISTNKTQRNILWLTAGLSAVTLAVSAIALFKKETVNVAPSPVIIQSKQPSKDSLTRLIQSLIGRKDTVHSHP